VVDLTRGFGATSVLHTPGAPGMLRRAATDTGIPAVTFELGAPVRLEPVEIEHGVTAIETLMNNLGMTQRVRQWREPQPIFYESRWVRAMRPGMLFSDVKLGDRVRQGQRLGRVVNPLSDEVSELVAPVRGRVLGMALNQVVLPGYAAFHVGEEASEAQVIRDAALVPTPTVETERMDEGAPSAPEEGSTEQVDEYDSGEPDDASE
jgi:predicted deacylase